MKPKAFEVSPRKVVQGLIDLYEKRVKPAIAKGDLGDSIELGVAAQNVQYLPHEEFEAVARVQWALGIVSACQTLATVMEDGDRQQIQHVQEILENRIALYR